MKEFSDAELLNKLKGPSASEANTVLRYIYQTNYPTVRAYVLKNNGKQSDAEDIFQEAMTVFYKKINQDTLVIQQNIGGYLYTTAKNLWLNRLRYQKVRLDNKQHVIKQTDIPAASPEADFVKNEKSQMLRTVIAKLSDDCRRILTHFYFDELKMKNVAERMGLADEQAAKNKKYKCLKKLKSIMLHQPDLQKYFAR
jgi:RNA polymerase sigma factor (sigma-70 family)